MSVGHVLVIALVLLNLLLAAAVGLDITAPRVAQAQVAGGGGSGYMAVSAALLFGREDALWVLDLKARKLTVLRCHNLPATGKRIMMLMDTRDVQADLQGKTTR
jgi:hypothetical protein